MAFGGLYQGKRVFVTGHTGFKGAWLSEWLLKLGADVTGFSLDLPTTPSLFQQLDLASRLHHIEGDITDLASVRRAVNIAAPDFVFHLAAQSLVRRSYNEPVRTYEVNVMGTVNVLEAIKETARPCVIVIVTTDKCYDNKEWVHSYREEDPLGGYDPYSSSKGAAELVVSAYRRSYFSSPTPLVRIASARAGNVIGGGDWAEDRIIPDCIRALQRREPIKVRNRIATRPWQHVLEPLSGYLWLAAALSGQLSERFAFPLTYYTSAYNFGPQLDSNRTVAELVAEVLKSWPGEWTDQSDPTAKHEARLLNLSADKAYHLLRWAPVWDFDVAVARTVAWYKEQLATSGPPAALTQSQILEYTQAAKARHRVWAT